MRLLSFKSVMKLYRPTRISFEYFARHGVRLTASSGRQRQNIRIVCDLAGFIPLNKLMKKGTARPRKAMPLPNIIDSFLMAAGICRRRRF